MRGSGEVLPLRAVWGAKTRSALQIRCSGISGQGAPIAGAGDRLIASAIGAIYKDRLGTAAAFGRSCRCVNSVSGSPSGNCVAAESRAPVAAIGGVTVGRELVAVPRNVPLCRPNRINAPHTPTRVTSYLGIGDTASSRLPLYRRRESASRQQRQHRWPFCRNFSRARSRSSGSSAFRAVSQAVTRARECPPVPKCYPSRTREDSQSRHCRQHNMPICRVFLQAL